MPERAADQAFALRTRRDRRGVTQAAIAEALGADQGQISRFELYGVPLPRGLAPADYEQALDELSPAEVA